MNTTTIRLDPGVRIVRSVCWRAACRAEFGVYRTVAFLAGGRVVVAFCHRRILDDLGYRVDRWKYGS